MPGRELGCNLTFSGKAFTSMQFSSHTISLEAQEEQEQYIGQVQVTAALMFENEETLMFTVSEKSSSACK